MKWGASFVRERGSAPLLVLVLVVAGCAYLVYLAGESLEIGLRGFDLLLLAHAVVIGLGFLMRAKPFDFFEVSNIFLGAQFLAYVILLRSAFVVDISEHITAVVEFDRWGVRYEIAFYSLLATVTYLIGYVLTGKSKAPPPEAIRFPRKGPVLVTVVVMTVCLASYYSLMGLQLGGWEELIYGLYFVRGIGISYSLGIVQPLLTLGALIVPCVVILLYRARVREALRSGYVILMLLAVFVSLLHNSRGALLSPFFMVLVAAYYANRIGNRGIVVTLLVFFVLIPTMTGVFARVIDPQAEVAEIPFMAGLANSFDGSMGFGMVLATFPDAVEFQYGRTFFESGVYPLLPRLLFKDKPEVYGSDRLWALAGFNPREGGSQFSISQPGEWYAQFGLVGILIGFTVFGFLSRRAYDWFQSHRGSAIAIFAYAYFLLIYHGTHRGAFPYIYIAAQSILVVAALWFLAHTPQDSLRVTASGRSGDRR